MKDAELETDFAGAYDEDELVELSEGDDSGGGPWTITIPISLALCPTTKCTSAC